VIGKVNPYESWKSGRIFMGLVRRVVCDGGHLVGTISPIPAINVQM
jgi:hypothetical protein